MLDTRGLNHGRTGSKVSSGMNMPLGTLGFGLGFRV